MIRSKFSASCGTKKAINPVHSSYMPSLQSRPAICYESCDSAPVTSFSCRLISASRGCCQLRKLGGIDAEALCKGSPEVNRRAPRERGRRRRRRRRRKTAAAAAAGGGGEGGAAAPRRKKKRKKKRPEYLRPGSSGRGGRRTLRDYVRAVSTHTADCDDSRHRPGRLRSDFQQTHGRLRVVF